MVIVKKARKKTKTDNSYECNFKYWTLNFYRIFTG